MARQAANEPDPITAQRGKELAARLERAGWRVAERIERGLEWWAAEVWMIESVWAPNGVRAYLTFLTDPQYETFGSRVWALGMSDKRPRTVADATTAGTFTLRHCWPRELDALVQCLAARRSL